MKYNSPLQRKRRWTAEQRKQQALRISSYKPWLTSTGPRTSEGKRKSSQNAYKHGLRGASIKAVYRYLAASRLLINTLVRKRKEREAAERAARRMAKQKVLHIVGDAPLPSVCHPACIAGSPSMAGDAATRCGMTSRLQA